MGPISILVADDHPFFRQGVVHTIRALHPAFELIEASNGNEVLDTLREKFIDLLFLDLEMPKMSGLQALRYIRRDYPKTKIVALTMSSEDSHIMILHNQRVNGYLLKNTSSLELKRCIEVVMDGDRYYSPDVAYRLYELLGKEEHEQIPEIPDLTERELTVLKDICSQYSNEEIAKRLNISVSSVKLVRAGLYEKTGCKTVAGLAVYAMRNGLYRPGGN
jgi:DNA-binding NarL/FixJ family response regulator